MGRPAKDRPTIAHARCMAGGPSHSHGLAGPKAAVDARVSCTLCRINPRLPALQSRAALRPSTQVSVRVRVSPISHSSFPFMQSHIFHKVCPCTILHPLSLTRSATSLSELAGGLWDGSQPCEPRRPLEGPSKPTPVPPTPCDAVYEMRAALVHVTKCR
jgi:hypothetical protein